MALPPPQKNFARNKFYKTYLPSFLSPKTPKTTQKLQTPHDREHCIYLHLRRGAQHIILFWFIERCVRRYDARWRGCLQLLRVLPSSFSSDQKGVMVYTMDIIELKPS